MSDLALVLALLISAIVMFAIGRPRMDAVALMMIVALPLSGVITVEQAFAGFADPNIILIAALFVVGEALVRTGVAQMLGDWLVSKAGRSEARLIVLLMIVVAGIGSFMSSTGVVAIFIPIVLRIARNARIPASRLMMPLSVAALLSGMMTLVATTPNLLVNAELVRQGAEGFHFFSFTPFGLPLLFLAIAYMLFARRLLAGGPGTTAARPQISLRHWIEQYGLADREYRVRVSPESPLIGKTLAELSLRDAGINILAIERGQRALGELRHQRDLRRKFRRHRHQRRREGREQADPLSPCDRLFDHGFVRLQDRHRRLRARHRLDAGPECRAGEQDAVSAGAGRIAAHHEEAFGHALGELALAREISRQAVVEQIHQPRFRPMSCE